MVPSFSRGHLAQPGERCLDMAEVVGSIPSVSTINVDD